MDSVYQHYNGFTLDDPKTGEHIDSRIDLNCIIKNTDSNKFTRECLPDIENVTSKSSYFDGEIYIKSKFNPRIIEMTLFFPNDESDGDLFYLKRMLAKKYLLKFKWADDWETDEKYLMVKLYNGFESSVYYGKETDYNGEIELKFIAFDPYWRFENEKLIRFENISVGYTNNIKSKGNVDTYPLIYITPNSTTIEMTWKDLPIKLSNLIIGQEYVIDCEKCQFYYIQNGKKVLCETQYESNKLWEYPVIEVDVVNTFKITKGSIKNLNINPNSRLI